MNNCRKVSLTGNQIYQKDGSIDSYTFRIGRTYNDIDLSLLTPYLKINYSDDSGDKILLNKTVDDSELVLVWNVLATNTAISGEAECQLSLENSEATIIFNSEVFKIDIKQSVTVDLCDVQSIPTAIQQLQTELSLSLEYVQGIIDDGYVKSINGSSGDVSISAQSIGAATPNDVQSKINELLDGTKTVKKCEKATKDADGNTLSTTYLKIENEKSEEWTPTYNKTFDLITYNYLTNLNPKCKKVFARFFVVGDTTNAPELGSMYVYTVIDGVSRCLFSPTTCFLTKTASIKEVSFLVEMCGSFAKVKCVCNYNSNSTNRDYYAVDGSVTGDYTAETVGTSIGQNYLSNIRFVISGQGHSFGIGTQFSCTTVKYNEYI